MDVFSGEEPPRQKDLASEATEDVDAPIRALITLRDPDATVLEGSSALVDVPVTSPGSQEPVNSPLAGPSIALATADLSVREKHLPEPTVVSSAVTPSSQDVAPPDSSPTVNVQPSEGTRP
jgi:hypothetical protein